MSFPARAVTVSGLEDGLELLGPIVRLQLQTASLKCGERPHRWYNPESIQPVPALRLDDGGVTGFDGQDIADVHHRGHPQSRWRDGNGISVGFTGHYTRMRARFGSHLTDGVAGENILVDTHRELSDGALSDGLVIVGSHGPIQLTKVHHAPPCVEFSRFCAGYAAGRRSDAVVTETLQFLNHGMRGFYATLAEGTPSPVEIAIGDFVYRRAR